LPAENSVPAVLDYWDCRRDGNSLIGGKGGKVVVANIPANIASTMEATGFLDLLMHRESVDAGIAALA